MPLLFSEQHNSNNQLPAPFIDHLGSYGCRVFLLGKDHLDRLLLISSAASSTRSKRESQIIIGYLRPALATANLQLGSTRRQTSTQLATTIYRMSFENEAFFPLNKLYFDELFLYPPVCCCFPEVSHLPSGEMCSRSNLNLSLMTRPTKLFDPYFNLQW